MLHFVLELINEKFVYEDGVLNVASQLVKSEAICFYPATGSEDMLPYTCVSIDAAVRCLSPLLNQAISPIRTIGDENIKVAVTMAQRILDNATHVPIDVSKCTFAKDIFAHERSSDGEILLGNRIANDADELQHQFAIESESRTEVEICAAALGAGHEFGHDIAKKPHVVAILSTAIPEQSPIMMGFTEWFLFSGDYLSSRLKEEQFATGIGYLAASIAAQDLHLVPDWNTMAEELVAADNRILPQFADFNRLLKERNGNPFSLSIGLSQLQVALQKSHPELAQKVPQLGPYYIGYYTAINPARIIQIFNN